MTTLGAFSPAAVRTLATTLALSAAAAIAVLCAEAAPQATPTIEDLTRKLWPKERIEEAIRAVDQQRTDGLLSDESWARRRKMLKDRLAGTYRPESLSVEDPPIDFIQNGGFEKTNPNSAKNRSRWLWWGGWSWGGDYENMWEDRPEHVRSGKLSARISCTGATGRIGISTAPLPAIPGVSEYRLAFWAKGEGDNLLFVNFEEGATGTLREKIGDAWKQYTLAATPEAGKETYFVYFYSIGGGTIWLDDVELVPVGGKLDE